MKAADDAARLAAYEAHNLAVSGNESIMGRNGYGGNRHDQIRHSNNKRESVAELIDSLTPQEYAAWHQEISNNYSSARNQAENLADDVRDTLAKAEAHRDDLLDRAATLPDGTKVFKNAAGDVVTLDGALVDPVLAETIIWKDSNPSQEDTLKAVQNVEKLQDYENALNGVIVDLADGENTLKDAENGGLSKSDREELQGRLDDSKQQIEDISQGLKDINREMELSQHVETKSVVGMALPLPENTN